jgi:hypothetical protein
MEADIDTWMNTAQGYRRCILAGRQMLSDMVRSDFNSTVLVDNASAAINVILRNMQPPLGPDDVILDLSTVLTSFPSQRSPAETSQKLSFKLRPLRTDEFPTTGLRPIRRFLHLADVSPGRERRHGASAGKQLLSSPAPLPLPLSLAPQWPLSGDASFIEPLAAFLKANASSLNIRCCVISHISAYPSVILPVAALTRLLRSYNIISIIDGAHAVGNIDIDITAADPDYYLGNMHKWFFSPKSAALLYAPPPPTSPRLPPPPAAPVHTATVTPCACTCAPTTSCCTFPRHPS